MLPLVLPIALVAGGSQLLGEGQVQDMEAMNDYMVRTRAKTPEGRRLRDAWAQWYANLSWYEKNIEESKYSEARNRITAFDRANTESDKELEMVRRIQEQSAQLEKERRAKEGTDIPLKSDGTIGEKDEGAVKLKWVWLGGAITTVFGLGAYLVPSLKAKAPLFGAATATALGTGTYVAFKLDKS
jgi:hypothetical protein